MSADKIELVSVNVSMPKYLGQHRGRPVTSGIAKQPVTAEYLWLDRLNLEGDAQADLRSHGGPNKAVYAYASEHLPAWSAELGQELGPAAFGENLTTSGATEDDVCIGDRWYWGDAVLEVCQPRRPCFKLAMHRGRGDIGRLLGDTGRTGWYLRVLQPGRVPAAGPISVEPHPVGATVWAMHEASRPGAAPVEVIEAMLGLDELAEEWKLHLAARLPD
ncbi:MAG: MOSC domain-containing protein [Acidimicrobiales bacterium]